MKAQLVFVALGGPKQEIFIQKLGVQLSALPLSRVNSFQRPVILMSVGGSFEEISGMLKKPPTVINDLGLKWLWRLILEPWRWRRQLALIEFVVLVVLEKFGMKKSD